jgi:protein-S-isoprenylcysteine O-methyltransferase Ste14
MDKKMSVMGVGGKIAAVLVAAVAVTEAVSYLARPVFEITGDYRTLAVVAAVIAVVGFAFCLIAAFGMLRAHSRDALATGGLYAVFLNPMYTFQLFVTVPGLLLLLNSWLVLLSVVPTFIAFKRFAREEEAYLAGKFGGAYAAYKDRVLFKFL